MSKIRALRCAFRKRLLQYTSYYGVEGTTVAGVHPGRAGLDAALVHRHEHGRRNLQSVQLQRQSADGPLAQQQHVHGLRLSDADMFIDMDNKPDFPDDDDGRLLQQLYESGDDITRPRVVDFCFIFCNREHALLFVTNVDDPDVETCLSWYPAKEMWQAIVKRQMVPEYSKIKLLELSLSAKAEHAGGKADGWGCMQIPRQSDKTHLGFSKQEFHG